jgi:hypothetical protein
MVGAHEGGAPATPIGDREKCMRTRGLLTRLMATVAALVIPTLMLVAAPAAMAAASPSPSAAEDQPLVNWTWLGVGLGGALVLLVIMYVLTRFFGNRRGEE